MTEAFDAIETESGQFFSVNLRSNVERVAKKRGRALRLSLLVLAGVFIIFFFVAYYLLSPHFKILADYKFPFWPFLLLIPAAMATVSFCLVYLIMLRSLVMELREILIKHAVEFIDPSIVHKYGRPAGGKELGRSLLFDNLSWIRTGRDHFSGRRGSFSFEFCGFRANQSGKKNKTDIDGIHFSARFERRFSAPLVALASPLQSNIPNPVGIMADSLRVADLERLESPDGDMQLFARSVDQDSARRVLAAVLTPELSAFCRTHSLVPSLSCVGEWLFVVFSGFREGSGYTEIFDKFDLELCRDFCLGVVLCLGAAESIDRLSADFRMEKPPASSAPSVGPAVN